MGWLGIGLRKNVRCGSGDKGLFDGFVIFSIILVTTSFKENTPNYNPGKFTKNSKEEIYKETNLLVCNRRLA